MWGGVGVGVNLSLSSRQENEDETSKGTETVSSYQLYFVLIGPPDHALSVTTGYSLKFLQCQIRHRVIRFLSVLRMGDGAYFTDLEDLWSVCKLLFSHIFVEKGQIIGC